MRIIGYRKADFTAKDGKSVSGYQVYIATDIDPRRGAGQSVERVYLSEHKCERDEIDLTTLLGVEIRVYYNRYGRVDTIVPVDD